MAGTAISKADCGQKRRIIYVNRQQLLLASLPNLYMDAKLLIRLQILLFYFNLVFTSIFYITSYKKKKLKLHFYFNYLPQPTKRYLFLQKNQFKKDQDLKKTQKGKTWWVNWCHLSEQCASMISYSRFHVTTLQSLHSCQMIKHIWPVKATVPISFLHLNTHFKIAWDAQRKTCTNNICVVWIIQSLSGREAG